MTRWRCPITITSLALAGASVTLLTAGCGNSPSSPGVASVASSPATASTTASPTPAGRQLEGAPTGGGAGRHFQLAMNTGNATLGTKFSACMRKHGVQNFPDPNGQGVITFGSGTGINPDSPTFRAATTTCQKLLPNGGQPTPKQLAQQPQKLLAVSQCMRAHGIKDFPDPTNGGIRIRVTPGSDLSPDNPQFQSAQTACHGDLPGPGT
jgi:hypothetical protein